MDVDRAPIDWCNRHNSYARAKFVLTSGTLREVEDPFDLIVCSEVLEHLSEPRPLVAAMSDKLAPVRSIVRHGSERLWLARDRRPL